MLLFFLWSLSIFYSSLTADGLSPSCLRSHRSLRRCSSTSCCYFFRGAFPFFIPALRLTGCRPLACARVARYGGAAALRGAIFLWSLSIFYSSLTADGLSPSCLRSRRSLRQLLFLNYFNDIADCIEFGTAAVFELYCIVQAVILSIFAALANKVIVNGFL